MTNRRRNKDSRRKRRASKAIEELSTVLLSYGTTDPETVDAAARDILRIGKRHGFLAVTRDSESQSAC